MRNRPIIAVGIAVLVLGIGFVYSHKSRVGHGQQVATSTQVVEFTDAKAKHSFLRANGLSPDALKPIAGSRQYVATVPTAKVVQTAGAKSFPNITYQAFLAPNDPLSPQYYTDAISAPAAWDVSTGSASTIVAVVDTGFALSHEDLAGRWATNPGEQGATTSQGPAPNCTSQSLPLDKSCNNLDDDNDGYVDNWRGWDFAQNDNTPDAGSVNPFGSFVSHGTYTSGLVGATGNNGVGVASINWRTRIMPLQALDDSGTGYTSEISTAVRYAADHGANVVSLSLGASTPDSLLQDAIDYARGKGVVVVAAAGNSGCNCLSYPANYPEVLSVGATDSTDTRASFSSYGSNLDVMAPGAGAIKTPYWSNTNHTTGYTGSISGTSISTPIVAGLAATILGLRPGISPDAVATLITSGADKVPAMSGAARTDQYGYGRINALASIRNFAWGIVSQAAYTDSTKTAGVDLSHLSPGQTAWLVLKARNTGNISWTNTGTNPIRLGTEGPRDRTSRFSNSSWVGPNRAATTTEASVAPGSVGTFEFPITVPATPGVSVERFNLLVEGLEWLPDPWLSFYTNTVTSYAWQLVGQAAYTDATMAQGVDLNSASPGDRDYVQFTARNIGGATWYRAGSNPIRVGTESARDRASTFADSTWLAPNRPSGMVEASVAPGSVGTFRFYYVVPFANGLFPEYYSLLAEGLTWMNNPGMNFYTRVNGKYSWGLVSEEAFSDAGLTTAVDITNLSPGQITYWRLRARNTGSATWHGTGQYAVRIGTERARDHTSVFCDVTWLGCNRPAGLSESVVAPNAVGTFAFKTTAPMTTGNYNEYFNLVAEGGTWLNDIGLYFSARVH